MKSSITPESIKKVTEFDQLQTICIGVIKQRDKVSIQNTQIQKELEELKGQLQPLQETIQSLLVAKSEKETELAKSKQEIAELQKKILSFHQLQNDIGLAHQNEVEELTQKNKLLEEKVNFLLLENEKNKKDINTKPKDDADLLSLLPSENTINQKEVNNATSSNLITNSNSTQK